MSWPDLPAAHPPILVKTNADGVVVTNFADLVQRIESGALPPEEFLPAMRDGLERLNRKNRRRDMVTSWLNFASLAFFVALSWLYVDSQGSTWLTVAFVVATLTAAGVLQMIAATASKMRERWRNR